MVTTEVCEEATWITIDRPEKNNALSLDDHHDLLKAIEHGSETSRSVIITGSGRAFSAGSDINALRQAHSDDEIASFIEAEFRLHRRIESLDVPVIAAVNGFAYGGGFELVLACDLAVAAERATFALPETRLGLTPGYALDTANTQVGRKRTLEMGLTGERINAETAWEWGVINRVVERSALKQTASDLAAHIQDAPPYAITAVKRAVNEELSKSVSYQRSIDRLTALLSAEETQSRLDDFIE